MNDELAALFVEYSDRRLRDMTAKLTACLERLSEAQIWERHAAHENAVGNLVLHLCGNMQQWVMHGVAGAEDVRVRDAEFSATDGMSRGELLAMFEETVGEARMAIVSLSAERLAEITHPQGRTVSVLAAVYQVVTHVGEHVGQIVLLTKQMTGSDLDLTIPRVR
jgi:uncharacterized damage-inducible protein DinB